MVLIFSIKNDFSTNEVVDYLISNKVKFYKINEDCFFEIIEIGNSIKLKFDNTIIDLNEVKSVWYRKSFLQLKKVQLKNKFLQLYKNEEINILNEFILHKLNKKIILGNPEKMIVNKLIINDLALQNGLKTPKSFFLSSNKKIDFKNLITKPINEGCLAHIDNYNFFNLFTTEIKLDNIDKFALSFFQNKIIKKYEIRTFYLNGLTFSMAIFSQRNKITKIDFRNYDKDKPNRKVPFKLPKKIEIKLDKLMKQIGLNTGSIDILVDKSGEYYFLEVNPVGQFGMVSYPCNYNLEKKIADYLINI